MAPEPRAALFLALCAVLIAAAVALDSVNPTGVPEAPHFKSSPPQRQPSPVRSALTSSARRFLLAFLRYEVGDLSPALTRSLRVSATHAFAAELLRTPPRPPRGPRGAAPSLGPLAFATVSSEPPLVSVSGTAHRPTGPEQLSFVFELRHGRWLASAPGE